jgi:phosphopantothenate synthetase
MVTLGNNVPGTYVDWPVDPTVKANQVLIKDLALRGVEEMFEAIQHLKNSKVHRQTEVPDFDREAFLEETVDAFNYFLSMLVLLGIDSKELANAYKTKHDKILRRIHEGY